MKHFVGPSALVAGGGVAALIAAHFGWAPGFWAFTAWLLFTALVVIPRLQTSSLKGEPEKWIDAENKARQTLAQVIGGFVLLAGAYSAWNQFQNQREQLAEQKRQFDAQAERQQRQSDEQRRQFQLQFDSQQRQIESQREQFRLQFSATRDENAVQRFARTVDQLSSDVLETRLAAIHTLAATSAHSPEDKWTVLEILTSFVRRRAPLPEPMSDDEFKRQLGKELFRVPTTPAKDVQLVLQFICSNDWTPPSPPPRKTPDEWGPVFEARQAAYRNLYRINLSNSDLRGALFSGARLDGADFSRSSLLFATFAKASLRGADLTEVDARGASLGEADLEGADLRQASLVEVYARDVNLRRANLYGATFYPEGPVWPKQLEGALFDEHTKLPPDLYQQLTLSALRMQRYGQKGGQRGVRDAASEVAVVPAD
jgi:uncharacterized protein YjbI with pentapeptide repeats